MVAFSQTFTLVVVIVINCVFILTGIGMVLLEMFKDRSSMDRILSQLHSDTQSEITIVTGCLDVFVGVCGLLAALLKKRILLMAYIVLLTILILGNVFTMLYIGFRGSRLVLKATSTVKLAITNQYGLHDDPDSRAFTDHIDLSQKMDECCGWSGIDGENLFLKSPWYSLVNTNVTGSLRTLPDTCCLATGDDCRRTENVKQARKNGFVKKPDCMDKMVAEIKFVVMLVLIQLALVTLLQIGATVFSTLTFLQSNVTDLPKLRR